MTHKYGIARYDPKILKWNFKEILIKVHIVHMQTTFKV